MARKRLLLACGLGVYALAACSLEGTTPSCPNLPEYDVRDAQARQAAWPALLAASEQGCITLPDDAEAAGGASGGATAVTGAGSSGLAGESAGGAAGTAP
ncbi:MAG TPA: hypothetical protein VFQ61_38195 [Polyangiaceae bacterium]|nr:hypothetical protein [Polyangiaceae bacterium]